MRNLPRQKQSKGKSSQTPSGAVDSRFTDFATSSRFRFPKKQNKVTLDKRLAHILKEDDFTNQASVDRYGRKVSKSQGKKRLERLYELEPDAAEDKNDNSANESGEDDSVVLKELEKVESKYDPARDGGFSTSDSDNSSDETDDSDVETDATGELPVEAHAIPLGDASKRLAIVNLDWDNIRADDIFAVASSFCPADGGSVVNVTIYPSEFGRERMDKEDLQGPPKEIFASSKPPANESEKEAGGQPKRSDEEIELKLENQNEEEGEFNSEELRKYQLDRLRYYYAVITCSSVHIAKSLYNAMDGQEYLSSANFFDLRFIPDDVTFDDRPRDSCDATSPNYQPAEFTTDALMHSKVKLTWEAEDTRRKEVQKRAFSRADVAQNDLLAYIASNSSSEESDEQDDDGGVGFEGFNDSNTDLMSTTSRVTIRQQRRDALRAALGLELNPSKKGKSKQEQQPVGGMQITFTPALSTQNDGASVFENEPIPPAESTAERYVRKQRERKAKRKEKSKANKGGEMADENKNNVKDDAAAAVEEEQEEEDRGFDDPFFQNPDTSIAEAKKAHRAKKAKLKEHQKHKSNEDNKYNDNAHQRAELELLLMDQNKGSSQSKTGKELKLEKKQQNKTKNKKRGRKDADDEKEKVVDEHENFDVTAPLLQSLYNDPDFAVDPTSHLYDESTASKALLEEKRRRSEKRMAKDLAAPSEGGNVEGDVDDLVQRVKKKAKR